MAPLCSEHCPWIKILRQQPVTPWISDTFGLSGVGLTQMYQEAQNLAAATEASVDCPGPIAAKVKVERGGFLGFGSTLVEVPGFVCGLHSNIEGV